MKEENMDELNFNSQICTTRKQSERLLALGLKKETADCALFLNGNNEFEQLSKFGNWEKYADMLPAWSLHRLIEMIDNECVIHLNNFTISGWLFEVCDNLFDNIIDCIEWIIKRGYFNKEYLEE